MDIADEIDNFLIEHDFEGGESEQFVSMLMRASEEIRNLIRDGETLVNVIADKNHNASVMRKQIDILQAQVKELKKNGKNKN